MKVFAFLNAINSILSIIYFLFQPCEVTKSYYRSKWLLQKLPSLLKEWSMFFANNEYLCNQKKEVGQKHALNGLCLT